MQYVSYAGISRMKILLTQSYVQRFTLRSRHLYRHIHSSVSLMCFPRPPGVFISIGLALGYSYKKISQELWETIKKIFRFFIIISCKEWIRCKTMCSLEDILEFFCKANSEKLHPIIVTNFGARSRGSKPRFYLFTSGGYCWEKFRHI